MRSESFEWTWDAKAFLIQLVDFSEECALEVWDKSDQFFVIHLY